MDLIKIVVFVVIALAVLIFLLGIRIVRPTHRGLIERLGKYRKFAAPGFNWIIPVIDRMIQVNITEQMVDAQPQEIITNDNLNARVDAQVYFKVKDDEESVKSSQYNVNNYQFQIVNLARTTLRNIIGTLTLKSANSERDKINTSLLETLAIGALSIDSLLRKILRTMQAVCRKFLDENQSPSSGYGWPYKAQLYCTLGELRALLGIYIARIAYAYDLEVDACLEDILPPEPEPEPNKNHNTNS
jgi:regulator of protease activity HflC (stomatin/prohibitin superfamily)